MPSELSPLAWLLLWVASLSSLATFLLALRRDGAAKRRERAEEERRWSLQWVEALDDAPLRCLRLRLHDVAAHQCRVKSLAVKAPGGAYLAPQVVVGRNAQEATAQDSWQEPWQKRSKADRPGLARRIAIGRDLDGTSARLSGQTYDDAYFYVLIPKKPAFSLSKQASLRVVCRVTEIARRSRRRKITLISPPVDWAPKEALGVEDVRAKG